MRPPVLLALVVLVPAQALAQDEFALPDFANDAGVPATEPTAPPLLPTSPSLNVAPAPAPAPKDPVWPKLSLSIGGVLAGWRNYYAGMEGFLGVTFGARPTITSEKRHVAGWLWVPGLEVAWSRLSGPVCAGSDFCGTRAGGGVGLRVGHAVGLARVDGEVRLSRFIFGGVSVHGMLVNVPPAPLTQGTRWGELTVRGRFGVQLDTANASSTRTGLVLHLSAFAEGVLFSVVRDVFQLGVVFGIGL